MKETQILATASTQEMVGPLQRQQGGNVIRHHPPGNGVYVPVVAASVWRGLTGWLPLLGIVVVPTLAAIAYFGVVASDRYVTESQFVVRSAERQTATGLGALLQSTGLNSGQDDAHVVQAFLLSRDALSELENEIQYSDIMKRDEHDILARWPSPFDEDNSEGLYDYYLRRTGVVRDISTGVLTLRVEAFTAQEARLVADTLLAAGERFINRMNARAVDDALGLARSEVALAEKRVKDSQAALGAYRRAQGLIDPVADTTLRMEMVARMSSEVAEFEAEARRLSTNAPGSPQLPALRARISALREQVAAEQAKLAGTETALSETYAAFEQLILEQKFSEEVLLAARSNLEQARTDAARKQSYLAIVVKPGEPDDAREPRRLLMILTVAATSFLIYAIIWLIWSNAREHKT